MTRDEIVALIVAKAQEFGIAEAYELLGGAIAESALNPTARRPKDPALDTAYWPDVSFGLFQQTARFADEGDQSPRADNIRFIEELYSDPVHAANVAARKFKQYRSREATALDAWCRYNWPAKNPSENPNRANYATGLAEAKRMLNSAATPPATPKVTYDPHLPVIAQNDDWSCAPTSARWAMWALGRKPTEGWMESTMLAEGVVSKEDGLLDATGAGLAAFIERHYGEYGYQALWYDHVSFQRLVDEIADGTHPTLIGGRQWNHWSAVRLYASSTDKLMLANPADGWKSVRQEMDRQQFSWYGPFSVVRIWHPDLLGAAPAPPITAPEPSRKSVLIGEIRSRLEELEALP